LFIALQGAPQLGLGPAGAHWEISPAEAKKLNDAWSKMARHYSPQVSEKLADHIQFIQALATVCGPRLVQTIFDRKARGAAPAPAQPVQPEGGGVTNTPPQAAPGAPVGAIAVGAPVQPRGPVTPGELDPVSMIHSHITSGNA
jgi:hypothetical protein